MPNVLILGGAGYLGLAVGQALLRSGDHSVFATTRDASKSKMLTSNELTAVVGEAKDEAFLLQAIREHRVDVVIDSTQAYDDSRAILESVKKASKERAEALAKDGAVGPKLGFVYTSGSMVHGSPRKVRINDNTVPGTSLAVDGPAAMVSWRPAHEQAILAARDVLDVAIMRPAGIYGRGSWVFTAWWGAVLAAAKAGAAHPVQVPTNKDTRMGVVHVDDLAAAYVSAIDKIAGGLGSWPVFDLNTETLPIASMVEPVADILGAKGPIEYVGAQGNVFLEALSLVHNSTCGRARAILGWVPARREFVQDLPTLVAAWKTTQE